MHTVVTYTLFITLLAEERMVRDIVCRASDS